MQKIKPLSAYKRDTRINDDIVKEGYYFSVNSSMLRTNKGKKIISKIPVDRILVESEGPFGKFNNKAIVPGNLKEVYNVLEHMIGVSEFSKIVFNNLKKLLIKQV